MDKYIIVLSEEAQADIKSLTHIIKHQYKAPDTAFKYVQGLLDKILSLSKNPKIYSIQSYTAFSHYGVAVRRINYKRMAIIYTVENRTVYIHRIIAASLIGE